MTNLPPHEGSEQRGDKLGKKLSSQIRKDLFRLLSFNGYFNKSFKSAANHRNEPRLHVSAMERTVSSLRIFSFHQSISQQHNFRKT